MINAAGREIPERIEGYRAFEAFGGAFAHLDGHTAPAMPRRGPRPGAGKLLPDLGAAFDACGIVDGATLSFHHHLRNGDQVLNQVLAEAARRGLKDLKVAASSLFPVHAPLIEHVRTGVVSGISATYIAGPVGEAIARGALRTPAVMYTHGGRARSIESGDLVIDVAFMAAPAADRQGNFNGVQGPSACGTLGYAMVDVRHARHVVAVTDHLLPYPACPADITQDLVDFVVPVASLGDPQGIVSGITRPTEDPVGLAIAETAADVIEASGLLVDGFSFQTGAGGISLAVAVALKRRMVAGKVQGSFAAGGITGAIVDMFEAGLFRSLFDVQCFDLRAVDSYRRNAAHQSMSASMYGNPHSRGPLVNQLDVMILGAAEIDLDFNVNVTTGTNGVILGGSGGHSDTAAGAKLALVTTRLAAGGFAKVVDRVTTATTPGETIDVLVTEAGVAVNPRRQDIIQKLQDAGIQTRSIAELRDLAASLPGIAQHVRPAGRVVAVVEYRDGTVIDVVRSIAAEEAMA